MRVAVHLCLLPVFTVVTLSAQKPDAAGLELFEKKIRPVLVARCYPCHSASSPQVQGGLWLDTKEGLRKGGNSGSPIVPGDPDASLLIKALRHTEESLKMPPGKPLNPEIVANFEQWVRLGAPDPRTKAAATGSVLPAKAREFWSFQKPRKPAVPAVADAKWVQTPVDAFILARLTDAKLKPSAEADKRTLIRRATYDLTGLPPSIEQIVAFLKDDSPQAFEKVVDRLLASPQYGERWGRHWMDVSRYADTSDGGARFAFAYTYRDWVIRAFNEDMPYNQFVMTQVAADSIKLADKRDLAALGFITLGRSVPKGEHDMIDDRIDAITRGMLGLTVTCARCHDHKFDPIPTRDYYSFYGMIANSHEPVEYPLIADEDENASIAKQYREGMQRRLKAIDDFKIRRHAELVAEYRTAAWITRYLLAAQQAAKMSNTEIEKLSRERDYNLFVLRRWRDYLNTARDKKDPVFLALNGLSGEGNREITAALNEAKASTPEEIAKVYGDVLAKFDSATPHPDAAQEALRLVLRAHGAPANVELADFMKIRGAGGDDNIIRGLNDAVRVWQAQYGFRGLPPRAMALEDSREPVTAHVFVRGNPNNPGVEAPPQFLTVLSEKPQRFTEGSGRLGLAKAIGSEDNPLTARVMVNRVWQWHFGRGLVGTASDFGTRGDAPTHPELLDYLAVRFMEDGWSVKKLHRMIMLSSTYRQSSLDRPDARASDPENKLVWRMNRQRLDYESLRDSILTAAGRLDKTSGGVPFSLTSEPSVPRRTVYGYLQRGRLPGDLGAFDFANPESHVAQRYLTTVPQQALYLMNSPFIAENAQHAVMRKEVTEAKDDRARVQALYRAVFARDPDDGETDLALAYVAGEKTASAAEPHDSAPWSYGLGREAAEGSIAFEPFPYFAEGRWQATSLLPRPGTGSASIGNRMGTAPDDPKLSVVRRWVSPVDGAVEVTGIFTHRMNKEESHGDGVRARVLLNGSLVMANEVFKNRSSDITLYEVRLKKGDTIDFAVDGISDPENDDFVWAPVITLKGAKATVWKAADGFRGPAAPVLGAWEKLAQVLLQTNEFAFVD